MCNENLTKYVYPVPHGLNLKHVFNLYATVVKECPNTRIALELNDIVLDLKADTTLPLLEQRYASYQHTKSHNDAFRGDAAQNERLVMRADSDILTDRYKFAPGA
jgi:hypothetical protein